MAMFSARAGVSVTQRVLEEGSVEKPSDEFRATIHRIMEFELDLRDLDTVEKFRTLVFGQPAGDVLGAFEGPSEEDIATVSQLMETHFSVKNRGERAASIAQANSPPQLEAPKKDLASELAELDFDPEGWDSDEEYLSGEASL